MPHTIPEEIITLDPDGIDFDNREAVKALIIKLLNIIESQDSTYMRSLFTSITLTLAGLSRTK